jgi:hypothetical protein
VEYATHGCRKLCLGAVAWYPELQLLRNRILVWNLQTCKIRGCRVGSKYLSRAIQASELPATTSALSLVSAVVAQRANFKAYQSTRKDHIASRESWLFTLAWSKSQDDGKPEEQHRDYLVSIECQQRQAKKVKMMNWKIKALGTSKVIATDSTGQWIECTTQEDIKAGCQEENLQCFSQTSSTPFMTSPLVDDFGYLAQGPSTLAVLEGTYAPPSRHGHLRLQALTSTTNGPSSCCSRSAYERYVFRGTTHPRMAEGLRVYGYRP